jgi:nucleoside-diphosphate-sugar epimerase
LGVRQVAGDLHDHAALARAAQGQDVVFHVAGLVAARDEAEFLRANRDGTANVVAAAAGGGARRVVLVSSMAAGGPAARGRPLAGDEPPHPVTAYGRSKLAAEEAVRGSAVPWTIIRPPMVYGPRDREVLKVFRLARLGVAPVFGAGDQELSAVHGADLANALVAAMESDAATGRVYYACHPEIFSSAGLVHAIAATMGRRVRTVPVPLVIGRALLGITGMAARLAGQTTILTADKANEFFQPAWTGDPSPLTRDSGWRAAHDLATGLRDTYAWYRAADWI